MDIKKDTKPFLDKEVVRAHRIISDRIVDVIRDERDFLYESPTHIGRVLGRYVNTLEVENGWKVSKVLIPDRASRYGLGYHRVAIVASTAETKDGVEQAIKKGIEIKAKKEHSNAHITAETIIVLSSNISFEMANKLRSIFSNEHRTVFIYSVKNALGVAKNALKAFGNLFATRAQKLDAIPSLKEDFQMLADVFRERGKKLLAHVLKLAKALEMMLVPKRKLQAAKDAAWLWLVEVRRQTRIKVFFDKEEVTNPDLVYERINTTAQLQGIDLDSVMESLVGTNAKQRFDDLSHAKPPTLGKKGFITGG